MEGIAACPSSVCPVTHPCVPLLHVQILSPAAQVRSFTQLTVTEGFETNRRGLRTFVLGVDAR
jgi:hypothetical protein